MQTADRFDRPETIPRPDPKRTALFLDFDGVLVEIADRPGNVRVPAGTVGLLGALDKAMSGGVTLLSGRAIDDLDGFLPDYGGAVVGGHGAETRRDGERHVHPFADDPARTELMSRAEEWATAREGLELERKRTGFVIHYRHAPELNDAARDFLADLISGRDDLEVHAAKMAYEIRPRDADKGSALLRVLGASDADRAVMIGDDETDEPAMRAAAESGGISIKVGPGPSGAQWRLSDPPAVHRLLRDWAGGAS